MKRGFNNGELQKELRRFPDAAVVFVELDGIAERAVAVHEVPLVTLSALGRSYVISITGDGRKGGKVSAWHRFMGWCKHYTLIKGGRRLWQKTQ